MELEELKNIGNSIGFFKVEELNIDKIKLLPEVRQMCSTDKCHMYGRNWSCPACLWNTGRMCGRYFRL